MNGKTAKKILMKSRMNCLWGQRAYFHVRFPRDLVPEPPQVEFPGFTPSAVQGRTWNRQDGAFIQIDSLYEFEQKESHLGWVGFLFTPNPEAESGYDETPIDKTLVERYRVWEAWHDRLREYGSHPVLDSFLFARTWARSYHIGVEGSHMYLTFGVKWFRPEQKRRFCAAVAQAVTSAKKAGIPVRVLRGSP